MTQADLLVRCKDNKADPEVLSWLTHQGAALVSACPDLENTSEETFHFIMDSLLLAFTKGRLWDSKGEETEEDA